MTSFLGGLQKGAPILGNTYFLLRERRFLKPPHAKSYLGLGLRARKFTVATWFRVYYSLNSEKGFERGYVVN